ncbi:MAG: hypothetical protein RLZZ273_815 [Bacteroidota bacterium]
MNIKAQILDAFDRCQRIVITTHINPDGDALGSSLGLYHWLQGRGKQVSVVIPNAAPANMAWLPGFEDLCYWDPSLSPVIDSADLVVVLDLNAVSRLAELGQAIAQRGSLIVNIDHHTHPENFADLAWIDTDASSTCSMIASLIVESCGTDCVSESMATCLYTGIMTDSGSFRFPRTNASLFRTVASLVEQGADPVRIYDLVMNQGSVGRMQLLGRALSQMEVAADGQLCVMSVSQQDIAYYGCSLEDIEGFVQQTLTLQGVIMGILIVEIPGEIKISYRSKGSAYVRDLAAMYGGGGHVYAAGARVAGQSLQQIRQSVTQHAANYLKVLSVDNR